MRSVDPPSANRNSSSAGKALSPHGRDAAFDVALLIEDRDQNRAVDVGRHEGEKLAGSPRRGRLARHYMGPVCGIAGLAGKSSERRAVLERISADLVHRGPDEAGIFDDAWVTLAIRRLSIIDVAGGHQPYHNEEGTVHVVFNGEIYGFAKLRQRLEGAGHRFASDTDGEVIAHAYEEYGSDFVRELDGMFAFALWERGKQADHRA